FHLKRVLVHFANDLHVAAERLELDRVALADVADDMWTRVLIAGIGAGGVGHDRLVELLAEFTTELGDTTFSVLRQLERGGALLHRADVLAHLVFEFAQQLFQFFLQLARALLLLALAFRRQPVLLAGKLLLALANLGAIAFGCAQFGVQAIEELADILRLRGEARARRRYDLRIQAEPLRDVDACGGTGNANAQFVGRLERRFVEADGGVEHALGVGAIYLQRRVVRGNDADAVEPTKML